MEADTLEADRALLGRTSTAERVAGILRARISAGYFQPGQRLAEKEITEALGVSRNTLREAFRLLSHERLLLQELNRGVFVRVPNIADLRDVYRVRKYVECAVVRGVSNPPPDLSRIAASVEQSELALEAKDWRSLGTANIMFHEALVALAESSRITELMSSVLAELRLAFHVMANPRWFHEPYVGRNREILNALRKGEGPHAEDLLYKYLDDAERQLVEAYAQRRGEHLD